MKIQNNFNESRISNNTIKNYKDFFTIDKNNNINYSGIYEKSIVSIDNLYDNTSLFSDKKFKDKQKTEYIHKKKRIINFSPSVYKKKIERNFTKKRFPYKAKMLSYLFNDNNNCNKNISEIKNDTIIINKDKKSKISNMKEKKNFNINNGMLIDYIVSEDEKLFINVKYVILINKRKNNDNKITSFNKDKFEIIKDNNFYIMNSILSIITVRPKNIKINKSINKNIKQKIKENIIKLKKKKKDENYYKKKKKFFFNYLKFYIFNILFKKYFYIIFWKQFYKKSKDSNIIKELIINYAVDEVENNDNENNENNNNNNDIINSNKNEQKNLLKKEDNNNNSNNNNIIRVKKLILFKKQKVKLNNELKKEKDIQIKLRNIIEKIIIFNQKNYENKFIKCFKKWKDILNTNIEIQLEKIEENENEIYLISNMEKYKKKLDSLINNKVHLFRLRLIYFSMYNKNLNIIENNN